MKKANIQKAFLVFLTSTILTFSTPAFGGLWSWIKDNPFKTTISAAAVAAAGEKILTEMYVHNEAREYMGYTIYKSMKMIGPDQVIKNLESFAVWLSEAKDDIKFVPITHYPIATSILCLGLSGIALAKLAKYLGYTKAEEKDKEEEKNNNI